MRKKLFPPTTQRVASHTDYFVKERIRNNTICCLNTYKDSNHAVLTDKMKKLDSEWDTERILETNAAALVLIASAMGFKNRKRSLFLLTGTVGFFLLQHALQGWCPPLPIIRSLGVRTEQEIGAQRTVLKQLRGDFKEDTEEIEKLLEMAEKS